MLSIIALMRYLWHNIIKHVYVLFVECFMFIMNMLQATDTRLNIQREYTRGV